MRNIHVCLSVSTKPTLHWAPATVSVQGMPHRLHEAHGIAIFQTLCTKPVNRRKKNTKNKLNKVNKVKRLSSLNNTEKKLCWLKCWPKAKSHNQHIERRAQDDGQMCVFVCMLGLAECMLSLEYSWHIHMQLCCGCACLRWIIVKPPPNYTADCCWPMQLKKLLFSHSFTHALPLSLPLSLSRSNPFVGRCGTV